MASEATPWPAIRPGTVSVVITVLKDPRVARTIESLQRQTRPPDEVWIDDGGGSDEVRLIAEEFHAKDRRVLHLAAPGNIAESRNAALLRATGEYIAFIDADEIARPEWLAALLQPFSDPAVGFTGGPTPALAGTARGAAGRFYDGYLRRFYDTVARFHPHALPMGNSAWRATVFRKVGLLHPMFNRRIGNEDQEVAIRALEAGFRGVYVPEAVVDHDFSDINLFSLLRKQRMYSEGGYLVWRRRRTTYEASPGRIFPYVVLPALVGLGLLLLILPTTRTVGLWIAGAGVLGLALLAVALTAQGARWEKEYPGSRFRALEILRRWATLYGAFRGLLAFGWSAEPREARAGEPVAGKR